jgi:XapX domain-containing protein
MTKILLGLLVGLLIGAGCRYFAIPVPSPPSLLGAFLVVAMTVGYLLTDYLLQPRAAEQTAQTASLRTNEN